MSDNGWLAPGSLPADADTPEMPQWDSVRLAVLNSRLEAIVRKMTNTIFRTGRSTVLNTCRDFSCCIVTKDDELLVMGESQPMHMMSGPELLSKSMKQYHPVLRRGDAFLHNSPYDGNSHPGDHCILVPVVDDYGNHQFTAIVKAHLADIGNSQPCTMNVMVRDVYEEGPLIFPCTKVQDSYKDIEDIIRLCQRRIRKPEFWYGDYLAMLGAARIGERELIALAQEVGWEVLQQHTADWFDYSEQLMIEAIHGLPSGRATVRGGYDPLPIPGLEEGVPLEATVEVKSEEAIVEVDLRNNPDCVPAGINLSESCSRAVVMTGIFNSLGQVIPNNGGSYRRVRIHLRENCVAGIPRHPASCSTATCGVSERIGSYVQMAMAELGDGLGMAECGAQCTATNGSISGCDPRRGGAPFIDMMVLGTTGGAGCALSDGWLVHCELGAMGQEMDDSTEVDELMHPIVIWGHEIVPDTEGAGRMRGAPSAYTEMGPADTEMEVMYVTDGYFLPAMGVRGGLPGGSIKYFKRKVDGSVELAPPNGHVYLENGETIIGVSTGGGGYGPPIERDVESVQKDYLEGWITRDRAASVYGVIFEDDGSVDPKSTKLRRDEIASSPPPTKEELVREATTPNESLVHMIDVGGDNRSRARVTRSSLVSPT